MKNGSIKKNKTKQNSATNDVCLIQADQFRHQRCLVSAWCPRHCMRKGWEQNTYPLILPEEISFQWGPSFLRSKPKLCIRSSLHFGPSGPASTSTQCQMCTASGHPEHPGTEGWGPGKGESDDMTVVKGGQQHCWSEESEKGRPEDLV